ncbi:hypothetical protein J3326_01260 [Leuconostoc mesenteroides]|uniref:hypothetical protein n=1 Tax=Leuconostoc mesenteroides TaxID=1245 RepID=UPI001CC11FFB|nr:hypothetical protein [Leuconostoc mesenteroides]MBZ1515815.1 hypothetical protein [Leuconostoc mesenteroides]
MTFDEAIAKVGTYLKNNDLSNSDNNDRFFHIILNELRQEYAPTVEMTKEQHDYIAPLIKQGKELGATFTEFWEAYKFIGASKKITPAFKSQEQAMQVWLHPETIKVVDE